MRKKLFAVIMSAMMMITFMPAMAFAGVRPTPQVTPGFTVSGYSTIAYSAGKKTDDDIIYDGTEHTISYVVDGTIGGTKYEFAEPTITAWKYDSTAKKTVKLDKAAVKDAGTYYFDVEAKCISRDKFGEKETASLTLTVMPRPVVITGLKAKNRTKAYDGKGFELKDSDFNISADLNGNKTTDKADDKFGTVKDNKLSYKAEEKDKIFIESLDCGLVAGDTLITKATVTDADVAEYEVALTVANINPNYVVVEKVEPNGEIKFWDKEIGGKDAKYKVTITKAENFVKLPKSNKTYKAKALKKSAKSFVLKATAEHGKATITKYEGSGRLYVKNGKLVVKKGTKVGTYKIKVTAHVQGDANYYAANVTKTISVKVVK